MAQINKYLVVRSILSLAIVGVMTGCVGYQSRIAFEAAEQLSVEEKYDQAVEKYFEAAQLEPGSKTYKLKLLSARTRAAIFHVNLARELKQKGKFEEALDEYRLAKGFDPGLEIADTEEKQLIQALQANQMVEEGLTLYRGKQWPAARKAAQQALRIDPGNAQAKDLIDALDKEKQSNVMDGIELDIASSEPLTLRFKNAKVKEVFTVLTKLTDINFIMDEDVRDQPITVFLEKASFAQAMELILQMNGLEKKVLNSKTIIIYPSSREKDKQYGDQVIQTFYLSNIDAKKAVNLLRTMLQLRKIYVHEERNALVIRDKPEVVRLAEQILEATDRGDSEVVYELELLEISHTDELDIGARLASYGTEFGYVNPGETSIGDSVTVSGLSNLKFLYTIPTANFSLKKVFTDSEILANPKIRVKNGGKAKVHVGSREPIVTTTVNATGETTSTNIQYVDVGVKLDLEATIHLDNTIQTKVRVEVSNKGSNITTSGGNVAFPITTTNAETDLVLRNGETTILGGLIRDDFSKSKDTFPIIGRIPLLGDLLSGHKREKKKREILLSITPHIVESLELPKSNIATIWSGGEDNLKAGPNFGAFAKPLKSEIETIKPVAAPAMKPVVRPAGSAAEVAAAGQVLPTTAPVEQEPSVPVVTPPAGPESPAAQPALPPPSLTLIGPAEATVGQEFLMAVQIDNAASLYSAPLFVNYDPARLQLLEVQAGGFLEAGGQPAVFSSNLKNDTGQVIVGYKQEEGGPGASGSGSLFIMRFKAQAAGSALIDLNRINFRNPQGQRLNVEPDSARVEIH